MLNVIETDRAVNVDSDAICDIIPVDTVINLMCAVAYKTAEQYKSGQKPTSIPVYHCNSGTANPASWGDFHDMLIGSCHKFPVENMIFPPACTFHKSKVSDLIVPFGSEHFVENTLSNESRINLDSSIKPNHKFIIGFDNKLSNPFADGDPNHGLLPPLGPRLHG